MQAGTSCIPECNTGFNLTGTTTCSVDGILTMSTCNTNSLFVKTHPKLKQTTTDDSTALSDCDTSNCGILKDDW